MAGPRLCAAHPVAGGNGAVVEEPLPERDCQRDAVERDGWNTVEEHPVVVEDREDESDKRKDDVAVVKE